MTRFLLSILLVPALAAAQFGAGMPRRSVGLPNASGPLQEALPSAGPEVSFFVTAVDKDGRPVTDLTADSLVLREDRAEQKIESLKLFHPQPLLIGVLVDTSGSRRTSEVRPREFDLLRQLFQHDLGPDEQAYVAGFADEPFLLAGATSDPQPLVAALSLLAGAPRGGTALFDAIVKFGTTQLPGPRGRSVVVVLSDFLDNASRNNLRKTLGAAQKAGVSVFSVFAPSDEPSVRSLRSKAEKTARRLAEGTGGEEMIIHNDADLSAAFERLKTELRTFYVLRYHSSHSARNGKSRTLKLHCTREDVQLRYPAGLFH